MAAKRPNKRLSIRAKTSALSSKPPSNLSDNKALFSVDTKIRKREKRLEKRTTFLNHIEKPQKKNAKKCRRPHKKLVTSLNSLLDALPNNNEFLAGLGNEKEINNPRLKSLKSQPGLLKKRAKLEKDEKARFEMNLVKMSEVGQSKLSTDATQSTILTYTNTKNSPELNSLSSPVTATASKFAAIRAWASANLEIHPNFK
ncbi:putative atp-dependent clp protease [Erysiphe neolycopersici]|uniref:Ribosome biogenesis protein SLX9 n=1 Tax=Erysiphe neolycopersici TaxID=212602 RepID=A0A420I481_9PEZI|nr:putative atp-dependent clp protease [Erysiphe neolycopersici]